MDDLGFDTAKILSWFKHESDEPYVLIRVSAEHAQSWADALGVVVRRCYVSDQALAERSRSTSRAQSELIAAKLPDAGSTMAGDFGEILVYLYQASKEHPRFTIGPKKWRLKQDRTKPAPYSDVVHLVLPTWPTPSVNDVLLCSEVKTKSTDGESSPITAAIEDCAKDRTSRLAKTLVWLRERALWEDLGNVKVEHLDRFINATDHPQATKHFRAVAVVCSSLVNAELADAPSDKPADYTLVVISIPELKTIYESVFSAARLSASGSQGAA